MSVVIDCGESWLIAGQYYPKVKGIQLYKNAFRAQVRKPDGGWTHATFTFHSSASAPTAYKLALAERKNGAGYAYTRHVLRRTLENPRELPMQGGLYRIFDPFFGGNLFYRSYASAKHHDDGIIERFNAEYGVEVKDLA